MRAFLKLNKGIMRMPLPWRLWMLLLIVLNVVFPLFFFDRPEAQLVLVAMAVSLLLMTGLTAVSGFSRLVGAGHIAWIPLVLFLVAIRERGIGLRLSGERAAPPTKRS